MKTYEFLDLLNMEPTFKSLFENKTLEAPIYLNQASCLRLTLPVVGPLPLAKYISLENLLKDYFSCDIDLRMVWKGSLLSYPLLCDYFNLVVQRAKLDPAILEIPNSLEDFSWIFRQDHKELDWVEKYLKELGFPVRVEVSCQNAILPQDVEVQSQEVDKPLPVKKASSYGQSDYVQVPIAMLDHEMSRIKIEGEVFKADKRITRNKKVEWTLYVYQDHDAMDVLYYPKDQDLVYQVGDHLSISGHYSYNEYRKANQFRATKIEILEPISLPVDEAPVKRIELHAHTKHSEMDGVADPVELVKRAYAMGHRALAITDHMVVSSFPSVARTVAGLNKAHPEDPFKAIYGCEMNMVEDHLTICYDPIPMDLNEATYVIFDFETTGLDPKKDDIIEFGAIKVKNHIKVDECNFFIKPTKAISPFITRLTNITPQMVEDGLSLEEGMKKIYDFIQGAILVAHNAHFDRRFLLAGFDRLGMKVGPIPVIDSYHMSLALLPNRLRYNLGGLAREFGINYDEEGAHRAVYDAQVLFEVFSNLLVLLTKDQMTTMEDLVRLQTSFPAYTKLRPHHVTVLAKNRQGLRDLYELVSISHTETLYFRGKSSKKSEESLAEPRIYRKTLDAYRENLLIGSACFNGRVFDMAQTGLLEDLDKELDFYDYIEIQPLDNYRPLLLRSSFESLDDIEEILTLIIERAQEKNKLVVATGDVHNILEKDQVFREVYINAVGIGGARHPLYIYNSAKREGASYPNQYLKTTDEMLAGYPYLDKDVAYQLVVTNPHRLSEEIEDYPPQSKTLYPPTLENSDQKLRDLVMTRAKSLYGDPLPTIVSDRLEKELKSILGNGYGVIYYSAYLLVKKSREDGYMVGSRGSVGSSLVATMAQITEVNPLVAHYLCPSCHYSYFFEDGSVASGYDLEDKPCPHCHTMMKGEGQNIPFETFLGFEGDKIPDIDLNFSGDYQEVAHNYTKELFGEDHVYRAGTIGTIAEKTAFGLVSGYFEAKHIEHFHQAYKEYLAMGCAGVKRSTGQHPGGIVVVPKDKEIYDFTPIQYPANNPESAWKTSHFEYHDFEANLLKLDILGHVDPTAMRFLEDVSGLKMTDIPLNDPTTLSLFQSTDSLKLDNRLALDKNGAAGLPEFGTRFVRRMLDETSPSKFSDLVRISGLSHGTDVWANNAQVHIKNRIALDQVIACRDDIMTVLMEKGVQPKLAFTIMEAVRKGRGLTEEWEKVLRDHHLPDWYIDSAKLIKYLFPKAHAVAYCIMGLRVAWFKVHRPLDFYAQFFSLRCNAHEVKTYMAGPEAIKDRIQDIQGRLASYDQKVSPKEQDLVTALEVAYEMCLRGYHFMPLSIHDSPATRFWPSDKDEKGLLIPFNALDGLGDGVAQSVVEAREENPFISIEDVSNRTLLNQTSIKELRDLQAFGDLSETNQLSLF